MSIDWVALFQVTAVTILAAVAVVGLMSLANWFLVPTADDDSIVPLPRRIAGYALIGVMGLIIAAGLYLIAGTHIARLLGRL